MERNDSTKSILSNSNHALNSDEADPLSIGAVDDIAFETIMEVNVMEETAEKSATDQISINTESQPPISESDKRSSMPIDEDILVTPPTLSLSDLPKLGDENQKDPSTQTVANLEKPSDGLPEVSVFVTAPSNSSLDKKVEKAPTETTKRALLPELKAGTILCVVDNYHAEDLNELELFKGDLIELEEDPVSPEDFWLKGINITEGSRQGQKGFFPREKVGEYDPQKKHSTFSLAFPAVSEFDISESAKVPPVPKGTTVVTMFPFEPSKQDELQFGVGINILVIECPEGGWWKGVMGMNDKNPITGWFPASLVKVLGQTEQKPPEQLVEQASPKLEAVSTDKKTAWNKRLKAVQDGSDEIQGRRRSTSAPQKREDSDFSSIEPIEETSLNDTVAIKKIIIPQLEAFGDHRASLLQPRESTLSVESGKRSRTNSTVANRSSIFVNNAPPVVLDVMQGATDEKVQDKIPAAVYKHLSSDEKKRLSVVWELIQTERDYVRDLAITIELFMKPMSTMAAIGPRNMQALFANIEQIFSVNSDFLHLLLQIEDLKNINAYAEAFLVMGERFMCYIPYCSSQQANSTKFLKSLLGKAEVKTFLEEVYKNPQIRQLDLPGFLLKPVQRICKYPLLIKEMIKNTPMEHSDLISLNRANERMKSAVATINECARKLNGMKPILEVQARFAEKINIANANRFLVREDGIHVMFSDGKKARKLFLFNDLLIFARKDWRDKHHVIEKTPLKDIRVCDISEVGEEEVTVLIEIEILPTSEFDPPNRYIISMATSAEKIAWLDAYKCLVRFNVKSKNIADITMTLSSADKGGDDEDVDPKARERDPAEDEAQKGKKQAELIESKTKELTSKIELLEKRLTERESKIKEWENKVQEIESKARQKEEELTEKINGHEKTIKGMKKTNDDLQATISELEAKAVSDQQKLQKKEAMIESRYKEDIEVLENQLKSQKSNSQRLSQQLEEKENEISQTKSLLTEQTVLTKKQAEEIQKLYQKLNDAETILTEKDSQIIKMESTIAQYQEEMTIYQSKIADIAVILGLNMKRMVPLLQLNDGESNFSSTKKSVFSLNSSYHVLQMSNRSSNSVQSNASILDLLENTRLGVEEILKSANDKQNKLNSKISELEEMESKLAKVTKELAHYESNISTSSEQNSFMRKKLSDLENIQEESKRKLEQKIAEISSLEEQLQSQKQAFKTASAEHDHRHRELDHLFKSEQEKLSKALKQNEQLLHLSENQESNLKENSQTIQALNARVKAFEIDIKAQNDHLKECEDKIQDQKAIISEIQAIIKKAQSEMPVELELPGGIVAQVKSFTATSNQLITNWKKSLADNVSEISTLKTLNAKLNDSLISVQTSLDQKQAELSENVQLLAKRTEKLTMTKEELNDAKEEAESQKIIANQLKHALEQTRAIVDQMKVGTASLEKQQKQLQCALDESRKEAVDCWERIKQQNILLQKNSETISFSEEKLGVLNIKLHEKELQLEQTMKQSRELNIALEKAESEQKLLMQKLEGKEADILSLNNKLNHHFKLNDEQSENASKTTKQLQLDLHEQENKFKLLIETLVSEKEKLRHDYEREIAQLKIQISEIEGQSTSLLQKLSQKETKLNDFEESVKTLRSRNHDLDLQIANYQSKVSAKESSVHELEITLANLTSTNEKLKQLIADYELSTSNLNAQITEKSTKVHRLEAALSSLDGVLANKEQRIADLKNQLDMQADLMSKFDREKKDTTRQFEEQLTINGSITNELQQLKKLVSDTDIELVKTKNMYENLKRDNQRDLHLLEEKHKAVFSKAITEKEQEIGLLQNELHSLKSTAVAEVQRLKKELDDTTRTLEKSHSASMDAVRKQLSDAQEEIRLLHLKYKDSISEKTEELKNSNSAEVNQIKSKFVVMVDMLKQNLSETSARLTESEKLLSQREGTLKALEIENVKHTMERKQLLEELKSLKEKLQGNEESSYAKIKTLEREVQDKQMQILQFQDVVFALKSKVSSLELEESSLTEKLSKEKDLFASQIEKYDSHILKCSENEEKRLMEIAQLQNDKAILERTTHEKQIFIEKLESRELSYLDTIKELKNNIADIKEINDQRTQSTASARKEIETVEQKVADLDSVVRAKNKIIASLESSLKNSLNDLSLREQQIQSLNAKVEDLNEKLVSAKEDANTLKIEMEKSAELAKKLLEDEKETLRKSLKDIKRKGQTLLAEVKERYDNDKQKFGQELALQIQRLNESYEAQISILKNELLQKDGELDSLSRELYDITKEHSEMSSAYALLTQREDGLLYELDSKMQLVGNLKQKIKAIEMENNVLSSKVESYTTEMNSVKSQVVILQTEHHDLLLKEQRATIDLDYAKKCISQLEKSNAELLEKAEELKALQIVSSDQEKFISKQEAHVSALQKLIAKQTKFVATLQIALLEISNCVSITLPWRIEDVMKLPEKVKASVKSIKAKTPFDQIDTKALLELVMAVKTLGVERDQLAEDLQTQLVKVKALEMNAAKAHCQLHDTSVAISAIEEKVHNERTMAEGELTNLYHQISNLEKHLDISLRDKTKIETLFTKLREEYKLQHEEKSNLENDYIQVYEQLQSTKETFMEKMRTIKADSNQLIEENRKLKVDLEQITNQLEELKIYASNLENEKATYFGQKCELDTLLKRTSDDSKATSMQLAQLQVEYEKLTSEFNQREEWYKLELEEKLNQFEETERNLQNAESRLTVLGETLQSTNQVLDEFRTKWANACKRVKDLETKNANLLAEILVLQAQREESAGDDYKQLKSQFQELQQNYELLQNDYNIARKDKVLAEQILQAASKRYTLVSEKKPDTRIVPDEPKTTKVPLPERLVPEDY